MGMACMDALRCRRHGQSSHVEFERRGALPVVAVTAVDRIGMLHIDNGITSKISRSMLARGNVFELLR